MGKKNYNLNKKVYKKKYKELFDGPCDKKEAHKEKSQCKKKSINEVVKKLEKPRHEKKEEKLNKNIYENSLDKKRKQIFKIVIISVLILILFGLGYLGYRTYVRNEILKKINDNINIEYGEEVTQTYILKDDFDKVSFSPKLSSLKKVGKHKVSLVINGYEFEVFVNIKDTTAPELEVQDVQKYLDEELPKAEDFVVIASETSIKQSIASKIKQSAIDKTFGMY